MVCVLRGVSMGVICLVVSRSKIDARQKPGVNSHWLLFVVNLLSGVNSMKRFLVMNVSQSYLDTLKTHDDYVVAAAKAAGSLYQFPEYSDMNRQDLFIAALRRPSCDC